MTRRNYPETVLEVIDEDMQFNPAALRAVHSFASTKPWRGDIDERKEKIVMLNRYLAAAYGIAAPELIFGVIDDSSSGSSYYHPTRHEIALSGRLSVVTYLHEFAHACGMDEQGACKWSINLFRRCFPKSFGRLVHRGHMLVSAEDVRRKAS